MPHKSDILYLRGKKQVNHSKETIDLTKNRGKLFIQEHRKGLTQNPRSKVDRQLK